MANTSNKEKTVTPSKKDATIISVYGTEKSKYMATGKEYKVTKSHSENLVRTGHATLKK